MTENPVYDERVRNLDFIEIGRDILVNARNELYLNMRFLDVALSSLALVPDGQIAVTGTDGSSLFFCPDALVEVFRKGRTAVNRRYLHSIFHCLFSHLWNRKDRDEEYWNLACDVAVEHVIDSLLIRAIHRPGSATRREFYRKLMTDQPSVITAERVYRSLCLMHPVSAQLDILKREFTVDDHSRWKQDDHSKSPSPRQKKWEDIRDRMQTEIETFSKEASDETRSLEEQVRAENRKIGRAHV